MRKYVRLTMPRAISLAVALAVSNFIFQALGKVPTWVNAVERTWFEASAIFIVYFICYLLDKEAAP
jgi:hypothetical protein